MSLVLQSNGGGQITLSEPATASNFTLSLPAATTTVAGTDATQTLTNKTIILPSAALSGSPSAGQFEFNGTAPYFDISATQRGVIPGMQLYRLNGSLAGANATGNQSVFGVGVTLSANTVYAFDYYATLAKTAGTTSHTLSILFGGTATINNILYGTSVAPVSGVSLPSGERSATGGASNVATSLTLATAITTATYASSYMAKGTVSISTGGTFIPQYALSAAPGGAYSTIAGSYFAIWPIGAAGSNTSVGAWA